MKIVINGSLHPEIARNEQERVCLRCACNQVTTEQNVYHR